MMRLPRGSKAFLKNVCLFSLIVMLTYFVYNKDDRISNWKSELSDIQKGIDIVTSNKRSQTVKTILVSTGETLAQRIRAKCQGRQLSKTKIQFRISTDRKHKLLFCPMCKLASTYWTRFFKFLQKAEDGHETSPYDVPIARAPPTKEKMVIQNGNEVTGYHGYYRYLFVRDPYTRLLSAYVDKLFAPNPAFWRGMAQGIIRKFRDKGLHKDRCGSDLKFTEYVKAIIDAHRNPLKSADCHDASFYSFCHVCEGRYDFIGKMETFNADSQFIYRKVGLNKTIDYLTIHGKTLADEDALMDTVYSPFKWKSDIEKCIPWQEALKRIWRKLQIRGVIGKDEFPLDENQTENISRDGFIKVIKDIQRRTPYSQRKVQRREALLEIYSDVPAADMAALRRAYADDFDFFEYESSPLYLFNKSSPLEKYGYLKIY